MMPVLRVASRGRQYFPLVFALSGQVVVTYELYSIFSSRRQHTRYWRDWSSDVCSSDLSVERPADGKWTGQCMLPECAAARNPELQATPPDTITPRAPMEAGAAAARVSSSWITAC